LAADLVYAFAEDKQGTLWIGTDIGISKYDGKRFINQKIDKLTGIIYSIVYDRKGNLWFASDKGIIRYDGKSFTQPIKDSNLPSIPAQAS